MSQQETGNGLQLSEGMILWSLCGRNEVKRILTDTTPSTAAKRKSDQHISQSTDDNSQRERNILEPCGTSTTKERMVLIDSLAFKTFPPEVQLCWSSIPGYKLGVMATSLIPQGVWIGPYQGKLVEPDKLESHVDVQDGTNLWEIFHENRLVCYVDGSDVDTSGWMRFIQCARSYLEQNLNAFQYQENIYYRAVRDIHVGEELLVWYDDSYPQYMGIPLITEPTWTSNENATHNRSNMNTKRKLSDPLRNHSTTEGTKILVHEDNVSAEYLQTMRQKSNSPVNQDKTSNSMPEDSVLEDGEVLKITQKPVNQDKVSKSMPEDSVLEDGEVLKITQKHDENISSRNFESESGDRCNGNDDYGTLKCIQCSTNFSQRNTLQMHVCPKQTNSPYQCGYCDLSFTNPSDLRSHVVKHVSEKPFKCGFCERSFVGSTTLNNHIRMHTGKKPFYCQKCGVTFSQGARYARHLRLDCNGMS